VRGERQADTPSELLLPPPVWERDPGLYDEGSCGRGVHRGIVVVGAGGMLQIVVVEVAGMLRAVAVVAEGMVPIVLAEVEDKVPTVQNMTGGRGRVGHGHA